MTSCMKVCTKAKTLQCNEVQDPIALLHASNGCTCKQSASRRRRHALPWLWSPWLARGSMQPCGVPTPKQASTKGQASPTEGSWAVKHQRSKATAGRKQSAKKQSLGGDTRRASIHENVKLNGLQINVWLWEADAFIRNIPAARFTQRGCL